MKKNIFYYLSTSIFTSALGFFVAIYMSRVLTPAEYGYIGIFNVILYIIAPLLAFFGIGLAEINLVTHSRKRYVTFKNKFINFGFINFILIVLIAFLASFLFSDYKEILSFIPFIALSRFLLQIQWMEMIQESKAKEYSVAYTVFSLMMLFFTVILISGFDLSWQGRLWALIIAEYLTVFYFYKNYGFSVKFFTKNELIEIFTYGLPIFIGLGAAWLLHESDKIIVLRYFDLSIVGIYTFSYLLGSAIGMLNQSFIKTLRPIYYKKLKEGIMTNTYHLKVNLFYAIFILIVSTILMYLLNHFEDIVLPKEYAQGSKITSIIFYAFSIFGIYMINSLVLEFYKKNVLKMIFFYCAAIVNIVFSIYFIKDYGVNSPAYGTLFGFFVLAMLGLLFSNLTIKNLQTKYDGASI